MRTAVAWEWRKGKKKVARRKKGLYSRKAGSSSALVLIGPNSALTLTHDLSEVSFDAKV